MSAVDVMLDRATLLSASEPAFKPGVAVRLPLVVDAIPLLAETEALGAWPWRVHFNADYHDGGWSGVVLRSANGASDTLYVGQSGAETQSSVSTSTYTSTATEIASRCPAIMRLIDSFKCPIKSARVLRLAAGAVIREHTDADLVWAQGEARLHIPLLTHPEVAFYVADQRVPMGAGECWYLDLSKPHRVHNESAIERIHLVLDCGVNDWLTDQVRGGTQASLQSPQSVPSVHASAAQFNAFREVVFCDQALGAALRAGMPQDEFLAFTVACGAERGFKFSVEEVRAEMNRARRDWVEQWIL